MKTVRWLQAGFLGLSLAVALVASQPAQAQTTIYYPPSTNVIVHPSALQPGAQAMIPGTGRFWHDPVTGAMGYRYLGLDGQWHGQTQVTTPGGGSTDIHYYSANPNASKSNGYRPGGASGGAPGYNRPITTSPYPGAFRPAFGGATPSYRRP